jgi:hypothetical protein
LAIVVINIAAKIMGIMLKPNVSFLFIVVIFSNSQIIRNLIQEIKYDFKFGIEN